MFMQTNEWHRATGSESVEPLLRFWTFYREEGLQEQVAKLSVTAKDSMPAPRFLLKQMQVEKQQPCMTYYHRGTSQVSSVILLLALFWLAVHACRLLSEDIIISCGSAGPASFATHTTT